MQTGLEVFSQTVGACTLTPPHRQEATVTTKPHFYLFFCLFVPSCPPPLNLVFIPVLFVLFHSFPLIVQHTPTLFPTLTKTSLSHTWNIFQLPGKSLIGNKPRLWRCKTNKPGSWKYLLITLLRPQTSRPVSFQGLIQFTLTSYANRLLIVSFWPVDVEPGEQEDVLLTQVLLLATLAQELHSGLIP